MNQPIIYIDMDGVLADFSKAIANIPAEDLAKSKKSVTGQFLKEKM